MTTLPHLFRRGAVYYWRCRLPRAFACAAKTSHLCFSLRTADPAQARRLSARLGAVLEDLRVSEAVHLLGSDHVRAIFGDVFRSESLRMDAINAVAKRRATFDPDEERSMDTRMGWVWRLLAVFGTEAPRDFGASCPARRLLQRSGLAEEEIVDIATAFAEEQSAYRFLRAPVDVVGALQKIGAPVTSATRAQARQTAFQALSAALLDTERRYGGVLAEEQDIVAASHRRSMTAPNSVGIVQPDTASGPPADAHRGREDAGRIGKPDPLVHTLGALAENFLSSMSLKADSGEGRWDAKTRAQARQTISLFTRLLKEAGVDRLSAVRQHHVASFVDLLRSVPTRYGQSPSLRVMPPSELRRAGEKLSRKAVGLSANTIRRHLTLLGAFFDYLDGQGFAFRRGELDLRKVKPPKPKRLARHESPKQSTDEARRFFMHPIFTGCASWKHDYEPGPLVYHRASYFAPMILYYHGLRRGEACGLLLHDLERVDGVPAMQIRWNKIRRIKNLHSDRVVPIHSELIRLGFLDYVAAIGGLGYEQVFPDLAHPRRENDYGDRLYDEVKSAFSRADEGSSLAERPFHRVRHGFNNGLKQIGILSEIRKDILGQKGAGEAETRYCDPTHLLLMQKTIEAMPSATEHLERSPIRLLPWVRGKLPAPWARERQIS